MPGSCVRSSISVGPILFSLPQSFGRSRPVPPEQSGIPVPGAPPAAGMAGPRMRSRYDPHERSPRDPRGARIALITIGRGFGIDINDSVRLVALFARMVQFWICANRCIGLSSTKVIGSIS